MHTVSNTLPNVTLKTKFLMRDNGADDVHDQWPWPSSWTNLLLLLSITKSLSCEGQGWFLGPQIL